MHNSAQHLINKYNLEPHPEGGYYRRIYESNDYVLSDTTSRYGGEKRRATTAIYYLLTSDNFSSWHQLQSDELWFFHEGNDITMHTINQLGEHQTKTIGHSDLEKSAHHMSIPANTWFAAEILDKDSFAFVSCTVSPGFEFLDFELGKRDTLLSTFPNHANIIRRLTRQ